MIAVSRPAHAIAPRAVVATARPRRYLRAALPILLLWALCLLDYGRLIIPGPWPRQYIALSDLSRQFYPFQRFVAQRLASGHLPTWNPYLYAGHPQLADPQTAVFSPLGLLVNLTAGHSGLSYVALEWRATLDYMLAALFAYLFFRRLANSTLGGLVGALCFTFGGFLSSYPLPQLPVLETALWLPMVLYCLDRSLASRRYGPLWAAATGLAGGTLALAGHAQTAMLAAYTVAAYAVYRAAVLRAGWRALIGRAALAGAIASGLAAAQLLPTLAFAAESTRAHLSFAEAGGGYDWHDFLELLFPGGIFQRTYYIGVLPLALAALAATRRAGRFWLILFLVAAVVALGAHTPLFRLLYVAGPGFAAFRDQERAAAVAAFAGCALAALGAAELAARGQATPRTIQAAMVAAVIAIPAIIATALLWPQGSTPGGSVQPMPLQLNVLTAVLLLSSALALIALRRRLSVSALSVLIVAVTAANLLSAGANLSRDNAMPGVPGDVAASLGWLAGQPGPFRVGNSSDNVISNNLGTLYGVAGPFGDSPIETRRVANLIGAAGSYRIWQLFNVKYIVTRRPPGAGFTAVHKDGDLVTYALRYGLPPAWAVRDVQLASSPAQAQQMTVAMAQPGATVVLEQRPALAISGPSVPKSQQETWRRDAPGDLELTAVTSDNAVLVISEPYIRGWTVTLDGRSAPLYHADAALMATPLPAGSHTIALRYRQPGLAQGLTLAAGALLLAFGALLWSLAAAVRRRAHR